MSVQADLVLFQPDQPIIILCSRRLSLQEHLGSESKKAKAQQVLRRQSEIIKKNDNFAREIRQNCSNDVPRLVSNHALLIHIHCHSSFISSSVKTTIFIDPASSVGDLCAAYIQELLSSRGVCLCRDQDDIELFSTAFVLFATRDPSGPPPLNERAGMDRPLLDLLPAAVRNRRVLLHSYWAPTSPHWELTRGNMSTGASLALARSLASSLRAQPPSSALFASWQPQPPS